ncbi:hypothetical protein LTS16_015625 [Friedmanniomyces endolithicus]|nr:hypothetical protein LTS16_015625 [Friedmanniomyces endolithicus]
MSTLARFAAVLSSPGKKRNVRVSAATQAGLSTSEDKHIYDDPTGTVQADNVAGYQIEPKQRRLDRWLDVVVAFSGSEFTFLLILAPLCAWAFAGIRLSHDENWQVGISDVQAILSYIFDSFLMRQQFNSYDEALSAAAQLRSRAASHKRMLLQIVRDKETGRSITKADVSGAWMSFEVELPRETWFGRLVTRCAIVIGHIVTICVYWASIAVWLGFGPKNGWSNEWQLYMNSATSALMVFVFSFLANIRERHSEYTKVCLDATFRVDSHLESKLRGITSDHLTNEVVEITPPKVNILQRAIYYYADVIGTLVGIALLLIVMIAWLAIGPVLHYNSNWWLLIGTYAGLIGLNDGFVLRNVQAKLKDFENVQFDQLAVTDEDLFAIINEPLAKVEPYRPSISSRISFAVGNVCAHELTVLTGVLVIFALIAGASALRWNTSGQLICNVPPSIIESFFMIILITGHNSADYDRRIQIKAMHDRRLKLLAWVQALEQCEQPKNVNVGCEGIAPFEV